MKCPRCKKPLLILEMDRVEVDYCPVCEGVWLDSGELELIAGLASGITLAADSTSRERPLRCPRCGRKMDKVSGAERPGISIDRCKKGHGLWFDGGELEALLRGEKTDVDNRISEHLRGIFEMKAKPRDKGEEK